jgi:PPM family protein phosphatase
MDLFRRLFNSSAPETQPDANASEQPVSAKAEPTTTNVQETPKMPETEMQTEPTSPPEDTDKDTDTPDTEGGAMLPLEPNTDATPLMRPPDFTDGATRQLPSEAVIAVTNAHLSFGQATDVGMLRSNNEDAVLSFFSTSSSAEDLLDFGVFIVADGMGGHNEGEVASTIAIQVVSTEVINSIYLPVLDGMSLSDLPPVTDVLVAAVEKANVKIHTTIPKGGGTTCTAVVLLGDRVYVAHVGDSRAYLINKDSMEQITRDHSMVQRLIELQQLKPEEAVGHSRSNELYKALGFKEELEVDAWSRRLPPSSRLILCSDGLWNLVREDEIKNIVTTHDDPQDACNKLVAMANSRGGTDNITVIVLCT